MVPISQPIYGVTMSTPKYPDYAVVHQSTGNVAEYFLDSDYGVLAKAWANQDCFDRNFKAEKLGIEARYKVIQLPPRKV